MCEIMEDMISQRRLPKFQLLDILITERIVRIKSKDEEPFTLKSGKKSRLFIDIKKASLNPYILNNICWNIQYACLEYGFINEHGMLIFDKIASVAIGGVPIATIMSYKLEVPQIIVRSEKHDRGTQSQVIGDCKGKKILLIEDVATTGGSIVNAVKAIRDAGGICENCIVIVDRQEGAYELSEENGVKLYSILQKSDFGIKDVIKNE